MVEGEVAVYSPATLTEALRLLADGGPDVRPLAGATDAMVKFKDGLWRPRAWVNLMRLRPELAYIRQEDGWVEIGALTSFAEILAWRHVADAAPLLAQAARTIGGPQIRNLGTIGGNVGTASPAGDSLPALYALEAIVKLVSHGGGERELPIDQFILGPGKTALAPGELIGAVRFHAEDPFMKVSFEKLGLRAAHAISVGNAAVRVAPGFARVTLGALGPTILRVPAAEAVLSSGPITAATVAEAAAACRAAVKPITDVRGTADYRRAMAGNLVVRGLVRLLGPEVMPRASAS